jgi:glycosyltransferase involved in cell wall biosynthesis
MSEVLTVVSPYGTRAATTRARALEWAAHLGLEVDLRDYAGGGTNRPITLLRHPTAVVRAERRARATTTAGPLLLLREASPFSRGGAESTLLRSGRPGVYDLDDAFYVPRSTRWDPSVLFPKSLKADRAARIAARVVVGNEVLEEWASRRNSDVVVVPTCVDPDDYAVRTSWELSERPVIGWLGSPSGEGYLLDVADALLAAHDRFGAVLRVVSSGHAGLGRLDRMVERVEWSPSTWRGELASFDIGIGPLPDNDFTRGKCAYKLLQYAASGVPFVACPVGANAAATERLGGRAAGSERDWTDAVLDVLAADAASRASAAAHGLRSVREHYSFSAWADVWRRAVLEP